MAGWEFWVFTRAPGLFVGAAELCDGLGVIELVSLAVRGQ